MGVTSKQFIDAVKMAVNETQENLHITNAEYSDNSAQIWFRHNKKKSGSWPSQISYDEETGEVLCNGPYDRARISGIAYNVISKLKELS